MIFPTIGPFQEGACLETRSQTHLSLKRTHTGYFLLRHVRYNLVCVPCKMRQKPHAITLSQKGLSRKAAKTYILMARHMISTKASF